MYKIISLLFVFYSSATFSQENPFMNDGNGRPLYMRTSYVAEGSPYLSEEYRPADITSMNDKVYKQVRVRVNFVESQVEYLTDDGQEMIALLPIKKITFPFFTSDGKTTNNFTLQGIGTPMNVAASKIYQLLDSGKCSLLKEIRISYKDEKRYGEATITRTFKKSEAFVALLSTEATTVRKFDRNTNAVTSLFGDQQAKVSSFIDQRKLNCKSETDLTTIFQYYNSL
jgi:hypothetical protein